MKLRNARRGRVKDRVGELKDYDGTQEHRDLDGLIPLISGRTKT